MRYVIHRKTSTRCRISDDSGACETAKKCPCFAEDSEDECVSEKRVCCLNCRYRRWTPESYTCMKHMIFYET
jgi:hypothetical protein